MQKRNISIGSIVSILITLALTSHFRNKREKDKEINKTIQIQNQLNEELRSIQAGLPKQIDNEMELFEIFLKDLDIVQKYRLIDNDAKRLPNHIKNSMGIILVESFRKNECINDDFVKIMKAGFKFHSEIYNSNSKFLFKKIFGKYSCDMNMKETFYEDIYGSKPISENHTGEFLSEMIVPSNQKNISDSQLNNDRTIISDLRDLTGGPRKK